MGNEWVFGPRFGLWANEGSNLPPGYEDEDLMDYSERSRNSRSRNRYYEPPTNVAGRLREMYELYPDNAEREREFLEKRLKDIEYWKYDEQD